MALSKITAFHCRCEVCRHEWITLSPPARCAKCKARTWNQPQSRNQPSDAEWAKYERQQKLIDQAKFERKSAAKKRTAP